MALREILKEGDETLRREAAQVKRFDERLAALADDMLETMRESQGIGLAAPQIGILKRLFVMELDEGETYVIINPEILESQGKKQELEGCLSLPGLYGYVERPEAVKLRYQNLQGETQELAAEGLMAACICHETDHLNGILFRDRLIGEMHRLSADGQLLEV